MAARRPGMKLAELQTVAVALLAAGKEREGIDLLDRAARIRGTPGSRGELLEHLPLLPGGLAEAEAEVRAAFAQFELQGEEAPRFELCHILLASGRMREAWRGVGGSGPQASPASVRVD